MNDMVKNYHRYGPDVTMHDVFKFFAIAMMIVDHIGHFFLPDYYWLRVVGRQCVPIWLFLAGYARPGRAQPEFYWLMALMMVSDFVAHEMIVPVNIFATIVLSRLFIGYVEKHTQDAGALIVYAGIALVLWPVTYMLFEYGSLAFLFALAGFYCREHHETWLAPASLVIAWAVFSAQQSLLSGVAYSPVQAIVMSIGLGIICYLLYGFRMKTFKGTAHNPGAPLVKFMGRNSHYIYAFHFVAFQMVHEWIKPAATLTPIK